MTLLLVAFCPSFHMVCLRRTVCVCACVFFQERKIATTSFLDASFMKTLASAIRFGTPLLVQVWYRMTGHPTPDI